MKNVDLKKKLLILIKEILWLLITGMLITAVLYPIYLKIDYLYWRINAFFIFVTITYFRYSVTFRSLPFLRPGWIRFVLFTFNLSLFIYMMHQEQKFVSLGDNFYTEDFGFPKVIMYDNVKLQLFKYLNTELMVFGTGSLIMISAFQMRLIISYWQYYKHKANALLES
jgi:hypothetical protein